MTSGRTEGVKSDTATLNVRSLVAGSKCCGSAAMRWMLRSRRP
jgi:hypothetical protein